MDNGNIHTPIGMFDTTKPGEDFICKEEVGILFGEEVVIKSCFTRVVITGEDGTEDFVEPVVTESCMRPGVKVVMPLVYKELDQTETKRCLISVSNPYKEIVIDVDAWGERVRTEYFEPKIKEKSCEDCQNCGRC